jgi:hypothetical protein
MMKLTPLLFPLAIVLLFLGGCASVPGTQVPEQVDPLTAGQGLEEENMLNVSIRIFEPGEVKTDSNATRELSQNIRKAEARYIPVHLKYTLQHTGYWGMVRVVPGDDVGTDLLVTGKIIYSDGQSLSLAIKAIDSTNRIWLDEQYAETASSSEHEQRKQGQADVFQDMYNTIANDLIKARNALAQQDIAEIRTIAELRFASTMAKDAYGRCLQKNEAGRYHASCRPAPDDPMQVRLAAIQARDDLLLDTINGYYDAYYQDLWQPYTDWRKFRTEELITLKKLERQALTRQVLGAAAIIGAIAIGLTGNHDTIRHTGALRDAMIIGGAAAIYSGSQKREESKINKEVMEELGASFVSESRPLVVEIDGETRQLTGTAEEQYAQWRTILSELYSREKTSPQTTDDPAITRSTPEVQHSATDKADIFQQPTVTQ